MTVLDELSHLLGVVVVGVQRLPDDPGQTRCVGQPFCHRVRPTGRCLPACDRYRPPSPTRFLVDLAESPHPWRNGPAGRFVAGVDLRNPHRLTRWAVSAGRDEQLPPLGRDEARQVLRLAYQASHAEQ